MSKHGNVFCLGKINNEEIINLKWNILFDDAIRNSLYVACTVSNRLRAAPEPSYKFLYFHFQKNLTFWVGRNSLMTDFQLCP